MSDWTWEYIPDSAHVVGGLTPGQCAEVEALAQRIADAVTVRMIGRPLNPEEAVSGLKCWPGAADAAGRRLATESAR